jgi:MoaA/NifB/PqqE/SkfB family radical SAM enzyme
MRGTVAVEACGDMPFAQNLPGTVSIGRSPADRTDHSPLMPDPADGTQSVPRHFADARRAIAAARMAYISRNRRIDGGSEAFARSVRDEIFADEACWTASEREAFFRWIAASPAPCVLALVLGAIDALDRRRPEQAVDYARRASKRLANDLFIQKLGRRAAGEGETDLTDRFCRAPFEAIETVPGGDVHFCCPAWLPVPIGNLNKSTPEEIWNSPVAQAIRASIHDGSYRYCSRVHCAHLSSDSLPHTRDLRSARLKAIAAERRTKLKERPERLVLAHDRSCTLSCPSCRARVITANSAEAQLLNRMADDVLLPLARDARRVRVTASGDPFGSRHFRYVMQRLARRDYPNLLLEIQTNGVLFTPAAWAELALAGRLALVAVSLDAADEATYAVVRRGGSFRRLHANLAFLAQRRREGEIAHFRLDFVVQGANFREMPDVVAIAERYAFDAVKFQMIRNWNTWSAAEFARHDIGTPSHPRYGEFLEVLAHPSLRSTRVQFWGMAEPLADARGRGGVPPAG